MHTGFVVKSVLAVACALTPMLLSSGASGQIRFVDAGATGNNNGSSWADAYNSLQDALTATASRNADTDPANDVSGVWVAAGTYMPDGGYQPVDGAHVAGSGDRTATFQLLNGVALYGGFAGDETDLSQRDIVANETILSGDLLGNDVPVSCTENSPDCDSHGRLCADGFCIISANNAENSFHVVTGSGTDATARIDGFTITAAHARGTESESLGGGMKNVFGNPAVTRCTFRRNLAGAGGGMFNESSDGLLIIDCLFELNSALAEGGGMHNRFSSPIVNRSAFHANSALFGGAMTNGFSSSPSVSDCAFTQNSGGNAGGGMFNGLSSSPRVSNCSFNANHANQGGAMYNVSNSNPVLAGRIFRANTAGHSGGAALNFDSEPNFINCTFGENLAASLGGGMLNDRRAPAFTNCVFSGNSAPEGGGMYNRNGAGARVANCTFSHNFAGVAGGAIFNATHGNPTLQNCILWGNRDPSGMGESAQIHTDSGTPVVNYSIVQGAWSGAGGVGVIDADPLFIDPLGPDGVAGTDDDDLQLMASSPGIDAGDNDAVPQDVADLDGDAIIIEPTPLDLDGNPRFVDDVDALDTGNPGALGPPSWTWAHMNSRAFHAPATPTARTVAGARKKSAIRAILRPIR